MATANPDDAGGRVDARAFACPGLYRIVAAKDGGICRVRVPLGELSAAQAHAVGVAARTHGNGIIELTNRSNLQIRGMPLSDAPLLIAGLVEAGLAPRESWADDTRNVLLSPMAGLDPAERIDVRPIARSILDDLTSRSAFAALSPKFSVQIDGGGQWSVADHAHDIWALAVESDDHGPLFAIGLAGPINYALSSAAIRFVRPNDCAETVSALISDFVELGVRHHGVSRMRDLLQSTDRDEVWWRTETGLARPFPKLSSERVRSLAIPTTRAPLGALAQRDPTVRSLGARPVLGRLSADDLLGIADVAGMYGDATIRLTPWRSFLIPNVADAEADAALTDLRTRGFIVSDGHPMARMIACSGSVGCVSAFADVQADAIAMANILGSSGPVAGVHLSGCGKSCAVPGAADMTLIAVGDGRYDLYRRTSQMETRFGARLAERVDIAEAGKILSREHT